jgi:hypothetical protein
MFEVGFLHLIRGKIRIPPVIRDTLERQRGLSEAAPSRNGNRPSPGQVPFYGSMGNVGLPTLTLL